MWIEKVSLTGWGGFAKERTLPVGKGLAVVLGGNESGKTSLAAAVHAAFFGLPSGAQRSGKEASVTVRLRDGSRTVKLTRNLTTGVARVTSGQPKGTVLFDGDPENDAGAWRRCVAGLLGVADSTPWDHSGYVQQGELGSGLDATLESWMGGQTTDTADALAAQLRAGLERLTGSDDGKPGLLEETREELALRRESLERWESHATRIREYGKQLEAAEAELETLKTGAKEREQVLDNLLRFQELTREGARLEESLATLRTERDRIRSQVEMVEQVEARLEKDFPNFLNAPTDVEDILHAWMESTTRQRHLKSDLERANKALHGMAPTRTRRNGTIIAVGLAVLGWLACLGAGASLLGLLFSPFFAAAGYAAVWYLDLNTERLRTERMMEVQRLTEEQGEVDKQESGARTRLGMLGRFTNPLTIRKEFRKFLEARNDLERARGARDGQRPLSEAVSAYEDVLGELQVVDTEKRALVIQARYLSGLDTSPELLRTEMEKARADEETAQAQSEEVNARAQAVRAELARIEAEASDPAHTAEEVARLEAEEEDMAIEADALSQVLDSLRRTRKEYQDGHLARVAAKTTRFFEAFSLGRYDAVRFDDETRLEARDDEGNWGAENTLSRGTKDQLLLALRLALHEELCGESGLPIVLDEAFPLWDATRLEAAGQVLNELADSGRQVLVLSSDPRLEGWVAKPIRLDEPGHPVKRAA